MKKKVKVKIPVVTPEQLQNEAQNALIKGKQTSLNFLNGLVQNGLTEAVLGFNPGGMGTMLSQVFTIFRNLRWYLISNMRQPLSQAYVEIGVIKTLVDVPVEDALRGGIEIKSKQLKPEEIEELQFTVEQDNDLGKVASACKWDRLYGGSGIIVICDQDYSKPFKIEQIKKGDKVGFRSCDMWELFWDKQNLEGDGDPFDNDSFEHYRFYEYNLHKTRVMVMKGIEAPSFIKSRLRGWGLSIVEVLVRPINQYLKANDLTFEVLDEFKVDVYKIKNLTNTLLDPNGEALIRQRVQLANQQKNFQSAITMDSEDDFSQKELSFQGMAEVMNQIRMAIASDLRMPLSKVFGISSTGFSSGEDDIENYNAMVESSIRSKIKHHIITMVKIRCQSLFGYVPDDLTVNFKPLRILSSEQEENVKTAKFARLLSAFQAGLMSSEEFKNAANKDMLFGVQVDPTVDQLPVEGAENGDGAGEAKAKAPATKPKEAGT